MRSITVKAALIFALALAVEGTTSPAGKEVNIWVARDVAPGSKVRLTINTRNVPVVHMAAYRLGDVKVLINREKITKRPAAPGRPAAEWNVTVAPRAEQPGAQKDIYRSRQVNLPPLRPGTYLLTASDGDKESWAVVNVTNLAVVVKRSPKRLLAWVTDARTGKPIRSARVTLYQDSGEALRSAATGADGACIFAVAPHPDQTAVITRGDDVAAVHCGNASPDGQLKAHFQSDRPIYRPGQTVRFKAILRRTSGRGYKPVANAACDVEVRDSKDNTVLQRKVTTNEIGTLSGEATIPSEGVLGPYSIVISVGKESAYGTFSVAEYRKPEFKVDVKPGKERYMAGEEAAFLLQAAYYFGAPLPQAEVRYQVRRSGNPYGGYDEADSWYASNDGNLYAHDTYSFQPFVAEGTLYTDDSGKVTIRVKTDKAAPDSTYSVTCTVEDASRRRIEASSRVPVYAASLRLGLHTDLLTTPLGSNVPLQLQVADLDGKPARAKVALTVKLRVWVEKEGRYRYKELAQTRVEVPAGGRASAKVPAKAEGELIIAAKAFDATGRAALAETTVWVAGPGGKAVREEQEPTIRVRLDRRSYQPGDTAKAWIGTSAASRPVLVTAEGADIWRYAVIPAGKKLVEWRLKTSVDMSPNAQIGACQWTRRSGLISASKVVPVPDRTRKLAVQLEPERMNYKPGEQASYIIRTTGSDGKPVPAEVALSVVDEAIYALRPDTTADLYTEFWGLRDNQVTTGTTASEEVSGGAYQRVNALASVRERFVDTAYWNAHVVTGAGGTARVALEIPGNLTTWRATARAVTLQTKVGSARASVQVSRPVMLRLAAPRQLVQGDRLTLVGTVNNRTDKEHEFETAISAEGLRVEGGTTKKVRVPAKGEAAVEWIVAADAIPENGQAFVTGRTLATDAPPDRAEEFSDALKVPIRIAPKGVEHRIVTGGVLVGEKAVTLEMPSDRIEPASAVTVAVAAGLDQAADVMAREALEAGRCGSPGAADQILAAAALGLPADSKEVRESLAALSRYQQPTGGWGWWDDTPSDPVITAHALAALARAKSFGVQVPGSLIRRGVDGALWQYKGTNLWEHRALLASALTLAGSRESGSLLDEVHRRGSQLSPYAQLSLAEAYTKAGRNGWAAAAVAEAERNAVVGPEVAYIPAGDHRGWSASTVETTAQALMALISTSGNPELQPKLAAWLARPGDDRWFSQDEKAGAAWALHEYTREHPSPARPGGVGVSVNGTDLEAPSGDGRAFRLTVPRSLLKDGANSITLRRTGGGEVFFTVEARVFRPAIEEASSGMRVLRRYDAMNAAGLWDEVHGRIRPGDPVRCTVLAWPDDRSDAVRVVEPIPAGFEFVDSAPAGFYTREELRDGAVIHFLRANGSPVFVRYYLRAESEGAVTALPAMAEALQRPSVCGTSAPQTLDVAR